MTAHDTLRAQLLALLQFQAGTPAGSFPREDRATMAQRLAAFAPWCQAHANGKIWSSAEQASWDRVSQALVASAAAQPAVALKTGEQAGEQADRQVRGQAGPMLHDVARLLRADGMARDEALELDAAVRWWEGARRAGLPVEADFGECWRALEWMALQQHLLRLAEGDTRDTGDTGTAGDEDHEAGPLAAVAKVALRYGPLKPLLWLLPVQPGAELSAGYTF